MSERLPLKEFYQQLPPPPAPPVSESGEVKGARLAILRMTPELLIWMGSGMFEVVANPLPSDAKIVRAHYDLERDTFAVVVESETFALVPYGTLLP
jgi:hypothetical protein